MRIALTFEGNPFSPITDFGEWYAFDPVKAAKCCSMRAALTAESSESPPNEQDAAREAAIDEICRENVTGYFKKYIETD